MAERGIVTLQPKSRNMLWRSLAIGNVWKWVAHSPWGYTTARHAACIHCLWSSCWTRTGKTTLRTPQASESEGHHLSCTKQLKNIPLTHLSKRSRRELLPANSPDAHSDPGEVEAPQPCSSDHLSCPIQELAPLLAHLVGTAAEVLAPPKRLSCALQESWRGRHISKSSSQVQWVWELLEDGICGGYLVTEMWLLMQGAACCPRQRGLESHLQCAWIIGESERSWSPRRDRSHQKK